VEVKIGMDGGGWLMVEDPEALWVRSMYRSIGEMKTGELQAYARRFLSMLDCLPATVLRVKL
jgi:hypothetical protein